MPFFFGVCGGSSHSSELIRGGLLLTVLDIDFAPIVVVPFLIPETRFELAMHRIVLTGATFVRSISFAKSFMNLESFEATSFTRPRARARPSSVRLLKLPGLVSGRVLAGLLVRIGLQGGFCVNGLSGDSGCAGSLAGTLAPGVESLRETLEIALERTMRETFKLARI